MALSAFTSVCQGCLVGDLRMQSIGNSELQRLFQKLASTSTIQIGVYAIPNKLCYICFSQLLKCHRFADMVQQSQKILQNNLDSGTDNVIQTEHPSPALSLEIIKTFPQTDTQYMTSIYDNLQDYRKGNYLSLYEDNPRSVKVEEDVKQDTEGKDSNCYRMDKCNQTDFWKHKMSVIKTSKKLKRNRLKIVNKNKISNKLIPNKYFCNACNKSFKTNMRLQIHFKTHEDKRKFHCDACSQSFFLLFSLRNHMEICPARPDDQTTPHHCDTCGKSFFLLANLKNHKETCIAKPPTPDPKHIELPEDKYYICDQCSKRFRVKAHLQMHLASHTGVKAFICETCGKAYAYQSGLYIHIRLEHDRKQEKFSCEVCSKEFKLKGTLKVHMRCHTGERPYTCNTCGMTFTSTSSLKQHIRRLHIEVKPYACTQCYLSFNQERLYIAHMRNHTAERPYSCDKCSKTFTTVINLKGHIYNVHSGKRPYVCKRCGRAYKHLDYLKEHMNTMKCKRSIVNSPVESFE